MFWNKKDDKKSLPDLPQIKSPFSKELAIPSENANMVEEKMQEAQRVPEKKSKSEKQSLPSFPDSLADTGFSQAAIKDAVTQDEIREPEEKIPSEAGQNEKFKTIEMDEGHISTVKENPYLSSVKAPIQEKKPYVQQTNSYNAPYNPERSVNFEPPPSDIEMDDDTERPLKNPESAKSDVFVKIEKFYSAKKSLDAIKQQIDQIDDLLKKIREVKMKEERELAVWEKEIALVKSRIQNVNETIFEKIST